MRVALFSALDLRFFGGGERTILDLAKGLREFDQDSVILTPVDGIEERLSIEEIEKITASKIIRYRCIRAPVTFDLIPLGIRPYLSLRTCTSIFSLDSTLIQNLILTVYSRLTGKKYVIGFHDPNPYVLRERVRGGRARNLLFSLYKYIIRIVLNHVRDIQVLNRDQVGQLRSIGFTGNIHYLPTFLGSDEDRWIERNPVKFRVLFVGRLDPFTKGIDLLNDVVRRVIQRDREVVFDIVGSGSGSKTVSDMAAEFGENIIFHGFVSEEKLKSLYSGASLFVSTSRVESLSLSVMEAQSFGLPCVSFDIPGPSDIIREDFQGILIPGFDAEGFADAILREKECYCSDKQRYYDRRKLIKENIFGRYGRKFLIPKFIEMLS